MAGSRIYLGGIRFECHDQFCELTKYFGNFARISVAGKTGLRKSGTFLQQPLPPTTPFPCRKYGHRSVVVPNSVHELRPGIA